MRRLLGLPAFVLEVRQIGAGGEQVVHSKPFADRLAAADEFVRQVRRSGGAYASGTGRRLVLRDLNAKPSLFGGRHR